MEHELTLRIILEKPLAGVDFGVQKGKGNIYETIQKQRSKGKDLSFEFTVRVKTGASAPNFLGHCVHGPTGERFIYIDIGTCAGQTETVWSRRLKIPLKDISSDMVERALADPDSLLETHVAGTGKDGGPTCGTIKPFAGWKVVLRGRS
jgi:Family of unknown function (DUF5990)